MTRSRDTLVALLREQTRAHQAALEEILELGLGDASVVDEVELADLLRFIHGQVQFASLSCLSACDPARPRMINPQYLPWNWGSSNPDTLYSSAVIADRYDYRVYGRLGTTAQSTFGIYTGLGAGNASRKLNAANLHLDEGRRFEIFVSRERRGDDWIELLPGAETFACYQVFSDWERQSKGSVFIECLSPPGPAVPVAMEETVERYRSYLRRLRENFELWVQTIPNLMFSSIPDNGMLGPMQPPAAQDGTYFTAIKWRLEPAEALVIDLQIPEDSPYSSICLTNRWSQMIDIDWRQTSLNEAQSIVDPPRRVRVLLSTRDLGVHNWLDASGYSKGIATWRTCHERPPERPVVGVVRESEVWDCFPENQRVTPEQRAEALRRRHRHFRVINAV